MTQPAGRPSSSLHQAVGEIKGQLDTMLTIVHPQIQQLDRRVTVLESFRCQTLGGAAVIGFLVSIYEVYHNVPTLHR